MEKLGDHFKLNLNGTCNSECVVQGEHYRFTVLTEEMLRMEYAEDGIFEDMPTQVVWNRNFDRPSFQVTDLPERLEISTTAFHLVYNKKEFTPNNLYIDIKSGLTNYGGRWQFGITEYGDPPREHNLKGTARTLDRIDGPTPLEFGLLDTSGRTFFSDSESLLIDEDGWVHPRKAGAIDYYYLGYGRNYFKAIGDFYKLSGPVPLLPRYLLGNWWSRYWKYTEESYMDLLKKFEQCDMPFSIAVIDMDWHIVDVPEKYGRGWTGYTWNKDFFPDPERFLAWLHERNYKVTLNLHPADGVMPHEEIYDIMAKELGVNTKNEDPIHFDVTNIAFLNAYFTYLHHPNEKKGVDFWWMDWQQGKNSVVKGLDPLWMLNHYHTLDLQRNGKRGVVLSRYAGLGSHRYPIGFSGDSVASWASLHFQPYFTANASNVGYTWWSHDIGGHRVGCKDNELIVRWMQFGAFSPINRMHGNANPFMGKEPWRYPEPYCEIMKQTLRLRHQLVPYLYAMNYRCHTELVPIIVPLYYYYPMQDEAYENRNQYFFGTELLVCPMTTPTHKSTAMSSQEAWIPAGVWTDMFTGFVYHGGTHGKSVVLSRPIEREAVLGRAGGIVPMAEHITGENTLENPKAMQILIFPGASNQFTLYEDEGDGYSYERGVFAKTEMALSWQDNKAVFKIKPSGDLSILPDSRSYRLIFRGFCNTDIIQANLPYQKEYSSQTRSIIITVEPQKVAQELEFILQGEALTYDNADLNDHAFELLDTFQVDRETKRIAYSYFTQATQTTDILSSLNAMQNSSDIEKPVYDALSEIVIG